VVSAGVTSFAPEATGVTAPMPWLRETEVAFAVTQESVEVSPTMMVAGEALRSQVGADGGGIVMESEHVAVPPAPVAVTV
jgi:hypothetical protein